MVTAVHRSALLSKYSSRQNKLWCAAAWKYFRGWHLEWKWKGEPFKSRLLFQFEPDGEWVEAQSYEDDIRPTLKWDNPRKEKQ